MGGEKRGREADWHWVVLALFTTVLYGLLADR